MDSSQLKLIFFVIIAFTLIYRVKFYFKFKKWAKILKRRNATMHEAKSVLSDIKFYIWVPNHPRYWGYCKQIYYGILHSKEVDYETKMKAFNKFDSLRVHGIRAPQRKY